MNDTLTIDVVKPLAFTAIGFTVTDINSILGNVALCLSIIYSIYKLYKELKK